MAIITDPDNLDRKQVIIGATSQLLSLYDCGALTDASATGTDGVTVNGTKQFTSTSALFTTTNDVSPGDILCIFNGEDEGHYVVDTVDNATTLTLLMAANFAPGDTAQEYEVREPTGGSIVDGVSEQALFSFNKEEWRVDSETFGSDDLRRHPFPYEGITPNQFEIGGLLPHDDWDYFAGSDDINKTKKLVKFGGWESLDNAGVRVDMYGGFLSLSPMDADAQAYYQQTDALDTPINFEFTGPINEPVLIHDGGAGNFTTYFKAFLRKKGKSYSSYNLLIEQPNESPLIAKQYSFPLTHLNDSAIVAFDAEIEGNAPWTLFSVVSNDTDGITTVSTGTFTNTGGTDFDAAGVVVGDVLFLSTGSDSGYYTITNVATTTITVEINNADFTTFAGDTGITFAIHTRNVVADPITPLTDGTLADVDGDTGTITSATDYAAAGAAADDMVIIVEAGSDHRGVYKIISVSTTELTVDTSDRIFTAQSTIDHYVVEPGMYLEYKEETITIASPGNITLNENGGSADDITRTAGSWIADGIEPGSIIAIAGASEATNNKSYTVESRTALIATLVVTDDVIQEGPIAMTVTAFDAFKRSIAGVIYAFHWRLFGRDSLLVKQFEYHQKQMRETVDIDQGPTVNRGDITDLLMGYIAPNATTVDLYIDDLSAVDTNSVTYVDATGTSRTENFVAAGTITFNPNLVADLGPAIYEMFFLNNDAGDDDGSDFGTAAAITVEDNGSSPITGNVPGGGSQSFDYDYDGNQQRGVGSEGSDAPIVLIAIGLETAQYIRFDDTITRDKVNNFALQAATERNYST